MEDIKIPKQFTGVFKPKKIGDSFYLLLGTNVKDSIKITDNCKILASLEIVDPSYVCPGCGHCVDNLNKSGGVNDGRESK